MLCGDVFDSETLCGDKAVKHVCYDNMLLILVSIVFKKFNLYRMEQETKTPECMVM